MRLFPRLLAPKTIAHAHCDLPCGVYDPAQARIEADQAGRGGRHQGHRRPGRGRPVAGQDRGDQQDLLGDQAELTASAAASPHRLR